MRKIPATIATQHPDNSTAPPWSKAKDPFVSAHQETEECFICFSEYGIEEYMWDWEGKNADASVVDKLLTRYYPYFEQHRLGKEIFLTFRLPNIWEEKGYSLLQAMTVILSSEDFARDLEFSDRPLFEVVLPMTVKADQLMHMHKLFEKFSNFKSNEFTTDRKPNTNYLEVIPLVEGALSQREIGSLLEEYIEKHRKTYGKNPKYIRPFLACSDPALTEGFLATKLSNKIAIDSIYKTSAKTGVKMFPWAGAGSLPFRGGITPENVEEFATDYAGLRTVTLQSAFRFDYGEDKVKSAVKYLNNNLSTLDCENYSEEEIAKLSSIANVSTGIYKDTLKQVAPEMSGIFKSVPKRRERRQHVGLLAYNRSSAGQELPRAITFTASFYSIGVPPEFIATGRTLEKIGTDGTDAVLKFSKSLKSDLIRAGKYLNKNNLDKLARLNEGWKEIKDDITMLEDILDVEFKPETDDQKKHSELTSSALSVKDDPSKLTPLIENSAKLRKSLG